MNRRWIGRARIGLILVILLPPVHGCGGDDAGGPERVTGGGAGTRGTGAGGGLRDDPVDRGAGPPGGGDLGGSAGSGVAR